MAFYNKIKSIFNPDTVSVQEPKVINNYYEAQSSSPARLDPPNQVQDANLDNTEYVRRTLIRKSRYLVNNSPILSGIVEKMIVNIIGGGLIPQPNSSDENFNRAAKQSFGYWAEVCDINGQYDFVSFQEMITRGILVDGDIFSYNTVKKGSDKVVRPRIQLIESHNISSLGMKWNPAEEIMYDGLIMNKQGEIVNYCYNGIPLSPDSITHYILPTRVNANRGIPLFAPTINTAIDIDDILAMEKLAVKEVSSHTDIIKTSTGEPQNMENYKRSRFTINNTISPSGVVTATDSTNAGDLYYKNQFGPSAKFIKSTDEWEAYKTERPSSAFQGFIDYLSGTICISTGLTPSVLLGTRIGGPESRRDIAQAKKIFERYQRVISYKLSNVYAYVIQSDIDNGFLRNPPKDWYRVKWVYPRSITVDYARESQEDRADVAAGLLSLGEYAGNFGGTVDDLLNDMAVEEQKIRDIEDQYKLETGSLRKRLFQFPIQASPLDKDTPNNVTPPTE